MSGGEGYRTEQGFLEVISKRQRRLNRVCALECLRVSNDVVDVNGDGWKIVDGYPIGKNRVNLFEEWVS